MWHRSDITSSTPYPRDKLVHELFEVQVERAPDAIAVAYEGGELTYRQLNERANQLARHLVAKGIQARDYVPVLMPRSVHMLIAQVAVLKCGGVYVPLDPAIPVQRQALVFSDCAARHVITTESVGLEQLGDDEIRRQFQSLRWISCASLSESLEQLPCGNLNLPLERPRSMYVMYTSGSTGTPKGVMVPHHAVNRLVIKNGYAQIESSDC